MSTGCYSQIVLNWSEPDLSADFNLEAANIPGSSQDASGFASNSLDLNQSPSRESAGCGTSPGFLLAYSQGLPRLGTELLLFHHGQTGYFHARLGRAELCQSSSVVVLDVGAPIRTGSQTGGQCHAQGGLCLKRPASRTREARCLNGEVEVW